MAPHDLAFGIAVSFLFGIIGANLGWNIVFTIGGPLVAVFFVLWLKHALHLSYTVCIFAFCIFLGAFYYNLWIILVARGENMPFNKKTSFSGVIVDEPIFSDKYQSFTAKLAPPYAGSVKIFADTTGIYHYGDALNTEGIIEPSMARGQHPASFFPNISVTAEHDGFWLREKLIDFKNYLITQFSATLPPDEAGLLAGITFGSQSGFTKELKNDMALSGTTHLVALSGYNISILVVTAGFLFGYFFSRRTSFYLTLALIGFFVLMVGAQASIIRAAIMGFLVLFARESGRMYDMRNAITLAALIMALADPTVLVFNVGFQLSFLSLIGIIYLEPTIKKILKTKKEVGMMKSAAITTAAAQLALFPLLSSVFGQFSPVAILANTLILGLIPLTMLFGFLLAGLNAISGLLGFVIAKCSYLLLAYELFVIRFFAAHAWPISFNNSTPALIIYYALLGVAVYHFRKPKHEKVR